ncbi:MAG: hypothetical protein IJS94_04070, partial [Clostridia bacterium]|nr:hypothetical protein [Clostridia bacterium]
MLAKMLKGEDYATVETTLSVAESQAAAKALLYDRRDLYEYGGWGCNYYGGSRYVTVSKYDYWEYNSASASQKESLRSAAMEIAKYANEHCTTDYEKALYVHDYIVQNCRYHTEAAEAVTSNPNGYPSRYDRIFTAYGCLVDKNAVCAGYASAYKYILDILGIDCVYVTGKSMGVGHAWNRVALDGQGYYVDMTWDDPDNMNCPKSVYYQYFNITTDDLLRDHSIDADFPHPVCKELKYNYFYYNNYVIEEYDYGTFCDMVNAQKEKAAVNIRFADPSDAAAAENDFITNKGYTSFSWLGSYFEYYFDNVNGYAVILVE